MEQIQLVFAMPIVQACLWLIAAFIVAAIVKAIVKGIFDRTRLKAYMTAPERGTEEGFAKTVDYVSRLAYFITFLYCSFPPSSRPWEPATQASPSSRS